MNMMRNKLFKGVIFALTALCAVAFININKAFAEDKYEDYTGKMVVLLSDPQRDGDAVTDTVDKLRDIYESIGAEVISADVVFDESGETNINVTGDVGGILAMGNDLKDASDAVLILNKIIDKGFSNVEILVVDGKEDPAKYYPKTAEGSEEAEEAAEAEETEEAEDEDDGKAESDNADEAEEEVLEKALDEALEEDEAVEEAVEEEKTEEVKEEAAEDPKEEAVEEAAVEGTEDAVEEPAEEVKEEEPAEEPEEEAVEEAAAEETEEEAVEEKAEEVKEEEPAEEAE
ncbi:MAG: hypothetical protein IK111_01875, partial [Lachnospiraceae bacterium]|nr:hypothetical protein [Lachnospiraceae bacterium]